MKNLKIIISVLYVLVSSVVVYGGTVDRDTLSVYFEKDQARIDTALDGNKEAVDNISRVIIRKAQALSINGCHTAEWKHLWNIWKPVQESHCRHLRWTR